MQVDDDAWATANWTTPNEIDATANFSLNCSLGIDDINNPAFAIYPNPAITQLTIDLQSAVGSHVCRQAGKQSAVRIYDVTGREMYQSQILNPKSQIDVSSFAEGTYFIQLVTEQGLITKKFIKWAHSAIT